MIGIGKCLANWIFPSHAIREGDKKYAQKRVISLKRNHEVEVDWAIRIMC